MITALVILGGLGVVAIRTAIARRRAEDPGGRMIGALIIGGLVAVAAPIVNELGRVTVAQWFTGSS
jgi:hypothetical protein